MTTLESHRNDPKKSSAFRKKTPVFDKKTLQALLDVHQENLSSDTGGVMESVSKVLSLSEEDITRAITVRVRALREDVGLLLTEVQKYKEVRRVSTLAIEEAGAYLNEDTASSLQDLTRWKTTLSREVSAHKKNPDKILSEAFEKRNATKQYEEDARMLEQVEIVFLLDEIARNRQTVVRETLESTVEMASPKSTFTDIRSKLFDLLSPGKRKKFSVAQKLDVLREEIREEQEGREYQECSEKILGAFGRREGQEPFHTIDTVKKILKNDDEGRVKFILGRMNQKGKIAFMMGNQGEEYYFCRDKKIVKYTTGEFVDTLDSLYFDTVGKFLREALDQGETVDKDYLADHAHELKLPSDIAEWILDCYVDLKRLRRTKDRGYQMPKDEEKGVLSSTVFKRVGLAQQFYELAGALNDDEMKEVSKEVSWDTIGHDYRRFREKRAVAEIPLKTEKHSAKVLHFTEIQFGHKDLDVESLQRFVDTLRMLPQEERPDQIVISGIVFGRFKNWEKDKHRLKVYEIDEQLKRAKFFLDQLKELGIPMVYNMSDNDALIAKEYTYDAVHLMESLLQGVEYEFDPTMKRHLARGAAYWQFEQAQRSQAWPQHFAFQWDSVFPYMLRSGRHLLSAEDVLAQHGEYMEEYLLLLYAYQKKKNGEDLAALAGSGDKIAALALKVLNIDAVLLSGEVKDGQLRVTSDFNMNIKTLGREWKWEEKHFFRQTPTAKVRDPLKEAREDIGQRHAMGEDAPRILAIEGEGHSVGSFEGSKTFVLSTPGLHGIDDGSGSYTNVFSDEGRRKRFSRGERFTPGITPVTLHDDGRMSIEFWNERFLDIAAKTRERMAYVFFSDWQTGSVTSRPDLYAKAMDYVFHMVAKDYKTKIDYGGDVNQCRNYLSMPNENCNIGLVRVDDQEMFTDSVIRDTLEGVLPERKANIVGVGVIPGNHEWNSGYGQYGVNHSLFLRSIFYDWLKGHADINYGIDSAVRFKGEYFKSSTILSDVQGYKVLAQHIFMDRMGKGGGGLPVYKFRDLLRGVGEKMEGIDVMETGHFHHPSFHMVNDKLGIINGSIAGMSGYEWWRGYNPVIGTTVLYLGGELPPKLDIVTEEALHNYEPQGFYSKANLAKKGFSTDKDFDPIQHGFGRLRVRDGKQLKELPQNGIQKYLWNKVDDILRGVVTDITPRK